MNEIDNPFSPGAGTPPPELAGRSDLIKKAEITLKRIHIGKSEKSFFLVGLRVWARRCCLIELEILQKP